jgi:hypothetical protein
VPTDQAEARADVVLKVMLEATLKLVLVVGHLAHHRIG